MNEPERVLLINDSWGIYVPQIFAERFSREDWGISTEDHAILLAGPDHPHYWETWDDVLRLAGHTNQETGRHYRLEQDGDLFAEYWGQA